jgi:hypothetical protein
MIVAMGRANKFQAALINQYFYDFLAGRRFASDLHGYISLARNIFG